MKHTYFWSEFAKRKKGQVLLCIINYLPFDLDNSQRLVQVHIFDLGYYYYAVSLSFLPAYYIRGQEIQSHAKSFFGPYPVPSRANRKLCIVAMIDGRTTIEQRFSLRSTKAHCTELQEQMKPPCNWYSSAHLFVQAAPNRHVCAKTIKYKTWTASWTSKCGMRLKASFLHFGLIASSFARGSLSCRDHRRLWYWAWAYAPKRVHGRWLRLGGRDHGSI